jgi:hypothetical protein
VTVAALYVDPKGVYTNLPDIDVWDEARDARLYAGPWPVVAHPPCARWSKPLAMLNEIRWGLRVGEDGGCFAAALAAVRKWGGVLEHPAYSAAWDRFQLPRPSRGGWTQSLDDSGLTTEVEQHFYGHACEKKTWLYYIGDNPPTLDWRESIDGTLPVISLLGDNWRTHTVIRHAAASATPPAFRDMLLEMARSVGRVAA